MSHHHVVLPAGEEDRRSRVALASSAAAQLVVEPFGAVPTGTDQMQPAEFGDGILFRGVVTDIGTTQPDIGSAPGHLGRHRDRAELSGLGDDPGLLLIVLGVEHHRRNTAAQQPRVQILRLGDVLRADQDRLTGGVRVDDVIDDGLVLGRGGDVHPIGFIDADVGRIRRDRGDRQLVELTQLLAGGQCGAGHPAHGGVAIDQRLDRDGVEHLAGLGGLDSLLGLDRRL